MDVLMSERKSKKTAHLVIEHSSGRVFCYREDPIHHKAAERSRREDGLSRVDIGVLDDDCDIGQSMRPDTYTVVPIGPCGG